MSEGFIAGVTKQRNAVVMVSYHIGRAIGNVKRARRQLHSIFFSESADRKSVKYINDAQFAAKAVEMMLELIKDKKNN